MSDPERLSRSPEGSLVALLLRAAAEEKPSTAVLSRTSAAVSALASVAAPGSGSLAPALGVKHTAAASVSVSSLAAAPSAAAGGTSAMTGTTLGLVTVAKWLSIGAVAGAVTLSSVQALIGEQGTKRERALPAAPTIAPTSKAGPRSIAAAPAASEFVANSDPTPARPSASEAQRSPLLEPSLGGLSKPDAPARTDSAFLAAEVRFVDQGRASLQRAAFSQAIEQLAPYESLFPRQQLLTEVLFMRMEAFSRLGDVERARPLAARILRLGVVGRQAAQAREILGP